MFPPWTAGIWRREERRCDLCASEHDIAEQKVRFAQFPARATLLEKMRPPVRRSRSDHQSELYKLLLEPRAKGLLLRFRGGDGILNALLDDPNGGGKVGRLSFAAPDVSDAIRILTGPVARVRVQEAKPSRPQPVSVVNALNAFMAYETELARYEPRFTIRVERGHPDTMSRMHLFAPTENEPGKSVVVVLTERRDNPGYSVTNAFAHRSGYLGRVAQRLGLDWRNVLFVEHYPEAPMRFTSIKTREDSDTEFPDYFGGWRFLEVDDVKAVLGADVFNDTFESERIRAYGPIEARTDEPA